MNKEIPEIISPIQGYRHKL